MNDAAERALYINEIRRLARPNALRFVQALVKSKDAAKQKEGADLAIALNTAESRAALEPLLKSSDAALAQRIVVADSGAPKRKFDGLLLIDGRITDASELDRIAPDRIESVEVIKGAAATQAFTDPRAANGVIKVTLKKS